MPFTVENADFIADKLASELLPDQEYREAYKNAEEAVSRRTAANGSSNGRIEFDVDWDMLASTDPGAWYLACSDNGDGMTRAELARYMTTLAVTGAGNNQGITGNQGMGLKISGPTRHREGLLIRSMKEGEQWMIQLGWNGSQYDLIPIGSDDELISPVPVEMFPKFVREQGSGTVVTFLGNARGENTFAPLHRPRGWLFKYLHLRFYRLSDGPHEVFVRVPTGDEDDWPRTRADADDRQRKRGGRSFNLSRVKGTASIWDEAAETQGLGLHGSVNLAGDAAAGIPAAQLHWWVLPGGPGSDVSTRTASGGSLAVLFQNELHDWRTSGHANAFFARLGVLYGKTRIAFVLEPLGSTIASDFARAHVLVGGRPVFESNAWMKWSDQFRSQVPEAILRTMAEEQARIQDEDPDRARRIRDRLKEVMRLLRPRRFKLVKDGTIRATGPSVAGAGEGREGPVREREPGPGTRPASGKRGIGSVLSQIDELNGDSSREVHSMLELRPTWVTEKEAENFPLVNGNAKGLHDRAAALAGEDGTSASILLLNTEFRGYQAILAAVNDWANPDGDDEKASLIEGFAREWIEQKMVEAVTGLRQLENGSTWLPTNFDDALSPTALTAAFMTDRYHTLAEVKRQAGAIRKAGAIAS